MDFTTISGVSTFDRLESLYVAPAKAVMNKIKIGALALFLLVASLHADAYAPDYGPYDNLISKTEYVSTQNIDNNDVSVQLGQQVFRLIVRDSELLKQRYGTYNRLFDSFHENFEDGQTDMEYFMPLFKQMAMQLSQLQLQDAFVDVSRKRNLIDFNMNLRKGYFLSVAKSPEEASDNVMFAISKEQQTLIIDEMPLIDLMREIREIVA